MEKRKLSSVWEKTKGESDLPHILGTISNRQFPYHSMPLLALKSMKSYDILLAAYMHRNRQGKTNVTNSINN